MVLCTSVVTSRDAVPKSEMGSDHLRELPRGIVRSLLIPRFSSGVVEDYDEKQMLLQEMTELMEEEIRVQEENREQSNTQEIKAKEIRKRALENLKLKKDEDNDREDFTPTKKRNVNTDVLMFLKEKSTTKKELKQEELEIRREELKLSRTKFQLERQERLQKLEVEK
ncbi:calponin homology domain-containing protein DDB_G0272472-like [Gigantopelta aegis]|uniref:calponin homology domain-containing protein DDB_G0272472-like n=1 Tax=Gigantopelta aegis TaxID=1735272 RepID=UPI001B88C883|nr:calponin homology domain-containing protein DDB_G0272472-like [Gigantopelta aegis]